jgi:hypothetical protein
MQCCSWKTLNVTYPLHGSCKRSANELLGDLPVLTATWSGFSISSRGIVIGGSSASRWHHISPPRFGRN